MTRLPLLRLRHADASDPPIGAEEYAAARYLIGSAVIGAVLLYVPLGSLLDGALPGPRGAALGAIIGLLVGTALLCSIATPWSVPSLMISYAIMVFYQIALMDSGDSLASTLMPMFMIGAIGAALLWRLRTTEGAAVPSIAILAVALWLMLHVPSVAFADPATVVPVAFVTVLFPAGVFFVVLASLRTSADSARVATACVVGFSCLMIGSLAMVPIEMRLRGSEAVLGLQYTNFYNVIALLLLLWPQLLAGLRRMPPVPQLLFAVCVAAVIAMSLSRGSLAVTALLIAATIAVKQRRLRTKPTFWSGVLLAIGFAIAFAEPLGELAWTWGLRLNLVSNTDSVVSVDLGSVTATQRPAIWRMCIAIAEESEYGGIGVGGLSEALREWSRGQWEFTGSHSLLLTVLVERGIFVAMFVVGIFCVLMRSHWQRYTASRGEAKRDAAIAILSLTLFLIFAHSTGSELAMLSQKAVNCDISAVLALQLAMALRRVDA